MGVTSVLEEIALRSIFTILGHTPFLSLLGYQKKVMESVFDRYQTSVVSISSPSLLALEFPFSENKVFHLPLPYF